MLQERNRGELLIIRAMGCGFFRPAKSPWLLAGKFVASSVDQS